MNTYFIVVASVERPEFKKEFGPYLCYQDAAEMMVDHLREILRVEVGPALGTYKAKIIEVYYTQNVREELAVRAVEEVIVTWPTF